jgi:hypothetical protein
MTLKADSDLIWHIDRARFRFEGPEAYAAWKKNPKVYFSFDPTVSDDRGAGVFADAAEVTGYFEITQERGTVVINLEDEGPVISAWVKIRAEIIPDLDEEALATWSSERGGWACATIDLGEHEAELHWDDGGEWRLLLDTAHR